MNKIHLISALFMGLMATVLIVIIWWPLALGYSPVYYHEDNRAVAIFEFGASLLAVIWLAINLIRAIQWAVKRTS